MKHLQPVFLNLGSGNVLLSLVHNVFSVIAVRAQGIGLFLHHTRLIPLQIVVLNAPYTYGLGPFTIDGADGLDYLFLSGSFTPLILSEFRYELWRSLEKCPLDPVTGMAFLAEGK